MDEKNSLHNKDLIINKIHEKLTEYLERYTTVLSELIDNDDITLKFTLTDTGDMIEISSSDIKYYLQNDMNEEILAVHDLVYHNIYEIEELFDDKSGELKNLLIFLEDKEGIIKKQIMEVLIKHKKRNDDNELKRYTYEQEIYDILFGPKNNNDDLK